MPQNDLISEAFTNFSVTDGRRYGFASADMQRYDTGGCHEEASFPKRNGLPPQTVFNLSLSEVYLIVQITQDIHRNSGSSISVGVGRVPKPECEAVYMIFAFEKSDKPSVYIFAVCRRACSGFPV